MKLGLNDHTFLAAGKMFDALEILKEAHSLGLSGVHFSTLWSFKSLSDEYLRQVWRWSEDHDLYLEVGMGACNPYSDCKLERDRDRDPRETLREVIPVAAKLGSPVVRTFFGFIKERFFVEPTLKEQITATVEVLREVRKLAIDCNVSIAVENHLALTSSELRDLVERAGPDYVGVCFDTGNPLALLEEPVEALENLLPYVCSTHFKDGILCSAETGAVWRSVPLGEGSVNLKAIAEGIYEVQPEVNLNIEDLWDVFPVPIFDDTFIKSLKHLTPTGMVQVIRWLRKGDSMLSGNEVLPLEDFEKEERRKIIRERISENIERGRKLLAEYEIWGAA